MITSQLTEQLVAEFWARAGSHEPFPRSLERAIMLAAPVHIVKVHNRSLDTAYLRQWLSQRHVSLPMPWQERRHNGCLVAHRGEAAIFIDGTLSAEEMRVAVAHEFGHFLAEYEWPRRCATRRLGSSVLDVLDGDRAPTQHELTAAMLSNVPFGVCVHYMDRTPEAHQSKVVALVEETADVVAAELLAPRAVVLKHTTRLVSNVTTYSRILQSEFGLTRSFAEWYAERLARSALRRRTFSESLGI